MRFSTIYLTPYPSPYARRGDGGEVCRGEVLYFIKSIFLNFRFGATQKSI
jgi:hypothetical protein